MAQASANSYHELCQMEVDDAVKRMIALDIPRTFANNSLFHAEQDRPAPYADMLRSILYATSQRRTDVKYCQGLNYIAGPARRGKGVLDAAGDHGASLLQGLLQ